MKDFKKFLNQIDDRPLTPGEIIKQTRESLNMSQNDLSDIVGIEQSNISAYENNKLPIGRDVALKFSKALGMHPFSLLYPNGLNEQSEELQQIEERRKNFTAA